MGSQKFWLLAGAGIPVLILLLAFTRFSKGDRPSPAALSNLTPSSSSSASTLNPTPPSSPLQTSSLAAPPHQLCVADTLPAGAEVRSLDDSSSTAGAVIGKVRPGAQITQTGGIQAKNGQESTLAVVPISFKRKDLLTNPESDGENPEELIKAVMWKVVFDHVTHICD